jgi:RNA polymerase sigma-70 factor, ECF subfamily
MHLDRHGWKPTMTAPAHAGAMARWIVTRAHDPAETAIPMAGRSDPDASTARRAAFDRLTERRLLRAYRLATLILRDASEAEDAVHDAAVTAWLRFDDLRDHDKFDAWFDRIVVNVCRQRLRQARIRPLTVEALTPLPIEDGASGRAEREALRAAMDRLKPEHREVVVLRHLNGHSIAEIAARTGEREGTVKSRLHYALRELRAAYDAADREVEGDR